MARRSLASFASLQTSLLGSLVRVIVLTVFILLVTENEILSTAFISTKLRDFFIEFLGGSLKHFPDHVSITVPLPALIFWAIICSALIDILSYAVHKFCLRSHRSFYVLSLLNSLWSIPIVIWIGIWVLGVYSSASHLLAAGTVNLFFATSCAGWLYTAMTGAKFSTGLEQKTQSRKGWGIVCLAITIYIITFTSMNWALWFNLRIPHGDSVMYEEHLWNFINGKGFRSYLDQGLFLGEHIQFIHLLLIPIYWFWPSHLLLELSETTALALGAIPTYLIARHHSKNDMAAVLLACAYLLYFPLHYLDIAADMKTFRPISFGVPLMLWAIYALEVKRWKQLIVAIVLALAAKEDYALVIAPLGLWSIWNEWSQTNQHSDPSRKKNYLISGSVAVITTIYLLFVVKIGIPWFRNGETVHYARYFEDFGKTPTAIVLKMITSPQLLLNKLITFGSILYFLRVLFPVGMPLRAWSQLLVGAPLFVLLCLNTIAMQPPIGPYHHFHAPLVPIMIWAAAASLRSQKNETEPLVQLNRAWWIFSCAFMTSILFGFSPLSIRFWDPGHEMFWKNQYVMDERAKQFEKVIEQIPITARVAATDYAHAKLTHYERSYDYSDYPRAVANYEDRVPEDTEYIVIDHRHKHSRGKYDDLLQIRELQNHPDNWEVLTDRTEGYFTILKCKADHSEATE